MIDQMPYGCQHMMSSSRWTCIRHFSSKAVSVDARNLIGYIDFAISSHPHNTCSLKLDISLKTVFLLCQLGSVQWKIYLFQPKLKIKDLHIFIASVIKLMPTLLRWIKVSKVNSEKKHNFKLSWSSWEIHLWYLLFELFSSHSTSPCPASSPSPSPSPTSSPWPASSSSSPSSLPAILSGESTVWARIWD